MFLDYDEEDEAENDKYYENEKDFLLFSEEKKKFKSHFPSLKSLNSDRKQSLSNLTVTYNRKNTHSSIGSIYSEFSHFREMEEDMEVNYIFFINYKKIKIVIIFIFRNQN